MTCWQSYDDCIAYIKRKKKKILILTNNIYNFL